MKISILTLFPGMFQGFLNESIIKRAIEKGIIEVELVNFRDYTPLKNGQVDDSIYGGGPGMLLRCEPIYECLDAIRTNDATARLLPGVINNESLDSESFEDGLMDYPSYTKPSEYRGMKVPDVLISGDHAKIEKWRAEQRILKTKEKRPDLMER